MNSPKADILVIDDTPENLNLLSVMLTEQGYKVRSVTKGATGLRGAIALPPDLILLDVNMPEMNGYEVCQKLKENEVTCEIPVIFISALGDVIDKVKAFSVGGVDYITKPFQVEEVLARIDNHLMIRRLQQSLKDQNQRLQEEIKQRSQAEDKFARAFRASPNPIMIITLPEGQFLDVNPSFLRMGGYNLEEVIGYQVNTFPWGQETNAIAKIMQQLPEAGSLYNEEFQFRTKSGENKVILLSSELIELSGVKCALLIANDITERKHLENEFISLVSHELRTPLTSIMGALDLLGSNQLGILSEYGQKMLNIATNNMERLIRLVNDILDLERMKLGKVLLHKVRCDARQVVVQAVEAMQSMADISQIELIVNTVDTEIWADCDRVLQILTNLVGNAIKFSEAGSKIWIDSSLKNYNYAKSVFYNYSLPEDATDLQFLLITIKDQGRGIPEDKLQTIFEPFQQVDASDSRKKGGSGLGLAICRNIVEQHQGKIWVESKLGEGSIFYVLLPAEKIENYE